MSTTVAVVNKILTTATLISHIVLLLGIVYFLIFRKNEEDKLLNFLGKHGLKFGFFFATLAMVSSLYYSDIAGYVPCLLCWYQRIAMYPMVVLFGVAWVKKDHKIVDYTLILALIGFAIALMHLMSYYGGPTLFNCDASGLGVSCNRRYVFEYGYISIPVMALTSFVLIIAFSVLKKRYIKLIAPKNG